MRGRPTAAAILGSLLALSACGSGTVRVVADPAIGDRARYRYEITATVSRSIEGNEPVTTDIATTLLADQEIVAVRRDVIEADVGLRRDGGVQRRATVLLDRSGAIRDIELVGGFSSTTLGLSELTTVLLPSATDLPPGELAPGERWSISDEHSSGEGRLVRLGVVDGARVAVVDTSLSSPIDDEVAAGESAASLTGVLRSEGTTSYDLDDGSVRRSVARSRGEMQVRIEPPAGVDAAPALGTIRYDIRVRVTRLR